MNNHVTRRRNACIANQVRPHHGTGGSCQKKGYGDDRDNAASPGLELDFVDVSVQVLEIGTIEQKLAEREERKQENVENKDSLN